MERVKQLFEQERPIRWLFAGDSITHGVVHTFGERDYVQIFEERIRCEMQRPFDLVFRTAISGWTTKDLRENLDWAILQQNPTVVSLMIGMNDACDLSLDAFTDNYNAVLDELAENCSAQVILHTPNPVIPGTEPFREPRLPVFAERVWQIAADRDLPLVNHWEEWQKAWKEYPYRSFGWMSDAIHPNAFGHRAFARLLMQELGIWNESSLCCRLPIP